MSELLFSYGTLRLPDVQHGTFGRRIETTDDALPGFRLTTVRILDPHVIALSGSDEHPMLERTDDPADHVAGGVLELTEAELLAADSYEVDDYARERVIRASGRLAWAYLAAPPAP
ncbi:gamma-glutamylcyclotransferase family protein [Agromyces atrinae]|uniref:Gamma-glutamylcyclotransferase (GGCT)/AIG2-like uncharacterized protein YtfP n=1 Tax=Agromyces atrinae TaxID=592376 RepID=A0A852S4T8_9MICO|nr:gamma-glutamylcyclotransferase family protein [Agromyces atrinae]NYD68328.1 gamma-glutamylcyclotransferase (GGCT)/AIG2-like uncharacterized protein YtfP [Agromyces atrinae]